MEEREEPIHMPRQRLQSHSLHRSTRRSGCAAHSACRVAYTLAHGLCEKARSSRRTLRRLRSSSFPGKPSYKKCLHHVGDAEADILLDVRAEEGVEAARRADAEAQALSRASARSTSAAAKWPASEKIFIYAHIPAAASQTLGARARAAEGVARARWRISARAASRGADASKDACCRGGESHHARNAAMAGEPKSAAGGSRTARRRAWLCTKSAAHRAARRTQLRNAIKRSRRKIIEAELLLDACECQIAPGASQRIRESGRGERSISPR